MARRKSFRIPGFSFSWKRAIGLTSARQRFARKTGIPTTRQGWRRKLGFFGLAAFASLLMPRRRASRAVAEEPAGSPGATIVGMLLALALVMGGGFLCILFCGGILFTIAASSAPVAPLAPAITVAPAVPSTDNQQSEKDSQQSQEPIAPAAEAPSQMPVASEPVAELPQSKRRLWHSIDQRFSTEAEFAGAIGNQVRLRRADGDVITVGKEHLSIEDQQWIRDLGQQNGY
jgi:hypothetical protein